MKGAVDRKESDCCNIFFLELLAVKVQENVKTLKPEYFCLKFYDEIKRKLFISVSQKISR
jgi:hypothetical protein